MTGPQDGEAVVTRSAEEIRDGRLAALEEQIRQLRAAAATDGLSEEERAAELARTYDRPHEYPYTLVLATGELVGHPGVQSTHHLSRALGYDVEVVRVITNRAEEAAP